MKLLDFDTKDSPISFIDLEMTGLESAKHEILEIGLVKVAQPGLEILEKWDVKVIPEHIETADPEALKVCGYTPEKWKDAIPLKEAMEMLHAKVDHTILAGWNIATDYSFMDAASTKLGIVPGFHKHIFDVNSYVKGRLNSELGNGGLSVVAKKLGVTRENEHTALADSVTTYEVYKKAKLEN